MQLIAQLQTHLADRRREIWAIGAISCLAFIIQVVAIPGHGLYGEPYLIARNIAAGKGFVYVYPYTFHESVTAYIPPLYAYLQLPFLLTVGETGIQIFNLVCLHAACLATYVFYRRYVSRLTAGMLYIALSFYIPFWALAYALEPNTLNILLLVCTVYVLRNLSSAPSTNQWLAFGALVGVQLLVRPDIMLGAVLFACWLLYARKDQLKKTISGLTVAAALALAIVAPWTIRNYVVFHKFVLVSANSGMNLFTGNNPVATGEFSETSITPESERIFREVLAYSKMHDQIDVDRLRYQIALDWIKKHPYEVLVLDAKKALYHWIGRNNTGREYRVESDLTRNAFRVLSILLIVFGGVGLMLMPKQVRTLLLTLFLYSTMVSTIFFVQSRHRTLKVDPFLVPLSVIGVLYVAKTIRQRAIKSPNGMLGVA